MDTLNALIEATRKLGTVRGMLAKLSRQTAEKILADANIPATRIYTIEDCANDPQFKARDMIRTVVDQNFGEVLHPGIVPKMSGSETGGITWPGPDVGAHKDQVLRDVLRFNNGDIEELRTEGVI